MQLQVIEVAIGLFAAFFLLSIVASAGVEVIGGLLKKRSKDLWAVIGRMIDDQAAENGKKGEDVLSVVTDTSVYRSMQAASRRKRGWRANNDTRRPSYLSARSFADAVVEHLIVVKGTAQKIEDVIATLPAGPLRDRLKTLYAEVGDDLVAVKAGIEGWFDDTMDRLEGAYRRWTKWLLFVVGLVVAFGINVSAVRIVDSLWNDPTLRAAVAESVSAIDQAPCPEDAQGEAPTTCTPQEKIEAAVEDLESLELPVGWTNWDREIHGVWVILGILPTALAVMMGAPFWFDLLTRLAGVRGARGLPPKAGDDAGSATLEGVNLARSDPAGVSRRTLTKAIIG